MDYCGNKSSLYFPGIILVTWSIKIYGWISSWNGFSNIYPVDEWSFLKHIPQEIHNPRFQNNFEIWAQNKLVKKQRVIAWSFLSFLKKYTACTYNKKAAENIPPLINFIYFEKALLCRFFKFFCSCKMPCRIRFYPHPVSIIFQYNVIHNFIFRADFSNTKYFLAGIFLCKLRF